MYVELDPEIALIFQQIKAVSTNNGRSYHMMKSSAKPRRTKQEIEEAKLLEEANKLEVELKMKKYAEMERQLAQQEVLLQNQDAMNTQANYLFEKGLIRQDREGAWVSVDTLEER